MATPSFLGHNGSVGYVRRIGRHGDAGEENAALASKRGGVVEYEGPMFRPPSEAHSFILQATVGCSWNHCTYCVMYRHKKFRVRPLDVCLAEVAEAGRVAGEAVDKVFVADGDALALDTEYWLALLEAFRTTFPRFRRASCYATALNILEKRPEELRRLREAGLTLLYIGPESGDDETLRRLAKGAGYAEHVEAARRVKEAGMAQSLIFLLGAGGTERSDAHAHASARLATEMDPEYLNALTLTVLPFAPIARQVEVGRFRLPAVSGLLAELRILVDETHPTNALFRANHASNYLPLAGRLPRDRGRLLAQVDRALAGQVPLRPEWARGL